MEKKGTPASPATALASSVLPVPGGPMSSTPLGMRAPSFMKRSECFRNSTISRSSSFSSSAPATCAKVTRFLSSVITRAWALPKFITLLLPPVCWRMNRNQNSPNTSKITAKGIHSTHQAGSGTGSLVSVKP